MKKNPIKHVAIIMDGNRRWAKLNSFSYEVAYKQATVAIKNVIEVTINQNIPYLTLFAFSTDNNNRNVKEISLLKKLMNNYIETDFNIFLEKNIRFKVIGEYYKFDENLATKLDDLCKKTEFNNKLNLTIALNYSGKQDLLQAINHIYKSKLEQNNYKAIEQYELDKELLTSELPFPDLLIRTGGNKRISNFFLWQIAYTELYFVDVLWPDFNQDHFINILHNFKHIERRYGK